MDPEGACMVPDTVQGLGFGVWGLGFRVLGYYYHKYILTVNTIITIITVRFRSQRFGLMV